MIETAKPALWGTIATFPTGTSHTPDHTGMVEAIASMLYFPTVLDQLNVDEAAMLLLACHFHDLGMAGSETENESVESREQVRRQHAVSVGSTIRNNWEKLSIPDANTAEILSEICKGHRPQKSGEYADWSNLSKIRIIGPNRTVRVQLISALIYLADELHIGEDRASQREQDLRLIVNPISRLHWRRHQLVRGPYKLGHVLHFEAIVPSALSEKDLRKALHKAFSARTHVLAHCANNQISVDLPEIQVTWIRDEYLKLLITQVTSDLRQRTTSDLVADVISLHKKNSETHDTLHPHCIESPRLQSLEHEIREAINELYTTNIILITNDQIILSNKIQSCEKVLAAAKQIDDQNTVYFDEVQERNEYTIFKSAFGRAHIKDHILPQITSQFRVNISLQPEAQTLLPLIAASPTATRLVGNISLPETTLSHVDTLFFLTVAGFCTDLILDPDLILDKEIRQAANSLFQHCSERLPKFLSLMQSVSLLRRLPIDQLCTETRNWYHFVSDVTQKDLTEFNISQSFPQDNLELSIACLVAATRRSGATVHLQNQTSAPFSVKHLTEAGELSDRSPDLISIHNGINRHQNTPISLRGSINKCPKTSNLEIRAYTDLEHHATLPVSIVLSDKKELTFKTKIRILAPELTCGRLATLSSLLTNAISNNETINVFINDEPASIYAPKDIHSTINKDFISYATQLATIDEDLEIPLILTEDFAEQLKLSPQLALDEYRRQFDTPIIISTFFLNFAHEDGKAFYEEYCGCIPTNLELDIKTKGNTASNQTEIDNWNHAQNSKATLSYFSAESPSTLANSFRKWVAGETEESPLEIKILDTHDARIFTKVVIDLLPLKPGKLHGERRVIYKLQPISPLDQYAYDAKYWQDRGDTRRSELANDIAQRIHQSQQKTSNPLPATTPPLSPAPI